MGQPVPWMDILGVRIHRLDLDQVIALLELHLADRRPRHVVTVNPEFLVQAQRSAEFRQVLDRADLAIADGVGLVWAARLLGYGAVPRVPGVDLIERLASSASRHGYRLFLLGGAPGVAEAAAGALTGRHAGLVVSGAYAGSPALEDEAAIFARVRAARPDVLLVAYGAPQQDLWIRRHLETLGVPLAMGVGGSFDFISGRVARAPAWLRRAGFEWLFRLMTQPWRWRRMLRLPLFAWLVLKQRFRRGLAGETVVCRREVSSPDVQGSGRV